MAVVYRSGPSNARVGAGRCQRRQGATRNFDYNFYKLPLQWEQIAFSALRNTAETCELKIATGPTILNAPYSRSISISQQEPQSTAHVENMRQTTSI